MSQPGDPKLRAVPDPTDEDVVGTEALAPPAADEGRSRSSSWVSILLGVLLLASLALLGWSRVQLAESVTRADGLQEEIRFLNQVVVERDTEIAAQKARLSDVRTRVRELITVLDAPLAPPADR